VDRAKIHGRFGEFKHALLHAALAADEAQTLGLFQDAIVRITRAGNAKLVAIRQDFSGALSGRALLIFPEAGSLELVRLVVGKQLAIEDIIDLEDEALAETGNIILNSWVATIANLLKHRLKMSLPVVMRGHNNDIFNTASAS